MAQNNTLALAAAGIAVWYWYRRRRSTGSFRNATWDETKSWDIPVN